MALALARLLIGKWVAAIQKPPSSPSSPSNSPVTVDEDREKLERTLQRIQALRNDAGAREIRDESINLWIKELKDLAYDADDVLDEDHYDQLRRQVEGGRATESPRKRKREEDEEVQVSDCTSSQLIPSTLDGMSNRIRKIRERFDEIAKDRDALRLREEDGALRRPDASMVPVEQTSSYVDESGIYGREGDREKIIGLLFSDTESKFSIVAIVGMGGLGKTTLAQLVYNDTRVRDYFDSMGWVCASENLDVARLTRDIIESVSRQPCGLTQLDALQGTLREKLDGRKVLLVLDDSWNDKPSTWESLRVSFDSAEMVRLIVTTRNDSVAEVMKAMPPYRLGYLAADECRLLFQHHAFGTRDPKEYAHLVGIGSKIIHRCGCLPLALKTLGGLLWYETDEEKWREILESDLWDLDKAKDEILPALRLSYHRLPGRLLPCFLYASVFPIGYRFTKEELVRLWVAQGYILPTGGNKGLEEIGSEYFHELQRRSFFQSLCFRFRAEEMFQMHDMIHALAHSTTGNECRAIIFDDNNSKACAISNEIRHLYLAGPVPKEFEPWNNANAMRTLLYFGDETFIDGRVFLNMCRLRALDLRSGELPDSIGTLKHLRHLRLHGNIERLPEAVCQLYNLQILDLRDCWRLRELPKGIGKLVSLRHLLLPRTLLLWTMPPDMGKLTNLQAIYKLCVGKCCRTSGGIEELKDLANLRELEIQGLSDLVSAEDARHANLKSKLQLQKLVLNFSFGYCIAKRLAFFGEDSVTYLDGNSKQLDQVMRLEGWKQGNLGNDGLVEDVLEGLQPHLNLMKLKVAGYRGAKSPTWLGCGVISEECPRLHELNIENCSMLTRLTTLPSLKALFISGCLSLTSLQGLHNMNFLEEIEITNCPELELSPEERLPSTLKTLYVSDCLKLTSVPGLDVGSLQKLVLERCPLLQFLPDQWLTQVPQHAKIIDCPRLKEWCKRHNLSYIRELYGLKRMTILNSFEITSMVGEDNFDTLENLCLKYCSQRHLPQAPWLPCTLQTLEVCYNNFLVSFPLHQNLTVLKSLVIHNCRKLTSVMGLQNLATLQCLEIRDCPKLFLHPDELIPPTLQTLEVCSCDSMGSLPLHHQSSLKKLKVWNCRELQLISVIGLQNLTSLESLNIRNCPGLQLSPDELLPSSLQSLQVAHCKSLVSLPLLHKNLVAFEKLEIWNCTELTSLPGLSNLSSLQTLVILLCPMLQLSPDECLPSIPQYVDIGYCPGLKDWCQGQNIPYDQ